MPNDDSSDLPGPNPDENAQQERLEALAVRAAAAAAMLQEVERAEEAEGLDADQLEAIGDKRTVAELELADVAAEMREIDAIDGFG
jgi:hypothetical protein